MNKKKIIKYMIFAIICMLIIFLFSNQVSSTSNSISKTMVEKVLKIFDKFFSTSFNNENTIDMLNYPIRKLAHFTIFFILGFSICSFLKELKVNKYVLISIVICLIYALFDEVHQLFINGRTAKIFDVFIDMSGVLFAIFLKKCIISKSKRGESHEKR